MASSTCRDLVSCCAYPAEPASRPASSKQNDLMNNFMADLKFKGHSEVWTNNTRKGLNLTLVQSQAFQMCIQLIEIGKKDLSGFTSGKRSHYAYHLQLINYTAGTVIAQFHFSLYK